MMRGTAGFEIGDGEELEVTLMFFRDGGYDGLDNVFSVGRDEELGREEGFAVWYALTETEREALKAEAWENAEPAEQEFSNPLEVF